jgi:arylsulfatase A
MAGVPAPAGIDGVSIVPTLFGQPGQAVHDYLYWEYQSAGRAQAVRFGPWKGVRNNVNNASDTTPELYNLADDLGETTNVAAQHPDLAAKAAAYMTAGHKPSWELK